MLIQLDHVKKEYEDFTLELDMHIPENRVTGLIGANGAGKSTTFKLMLGLIRPDAGDVKVFGKKAGDPWCRSPGRRTPCGCCRCCRSGPPGLLRAAGSGR